MASSTAHVNFNIKKFDMKRIPQDAVVIFIGRRRTGKSTLVRDLLYHHQDMPLGTVISGTEESNSFYGKMIPSIFIHNEFNPIILANYVKRQRMIVAKIVEDTSRGVKSRLDPRSFMILDDCMYDDSWTHDKNIRNLFMNGRHWKTFFLITMQYPLGIQPALRTNVDFVFILREPYLNNRKRIYDNYASAFPSFEFFCQIMDQCTQNFEVLVIDNTSLSSKLEDTIFWYKATIQPEFRIGAPEFWQHSGAQAYRDREEEASPYDPNAARKLKGPPVNVRKF
jgi:hypothetical protein